MSNKYAQEYRCCCSRGPLTPRPFLQRTIINNMYELTQSSNQWESPEMNSHNMLGFWFAASHQPWSTITSLLLELAAQADVQSQLRKELGDQAELADFKSLDRLPLLDSSMKEVVRLNLADRGMIRRHITYLSIVDVRRKAVLPYDFSDGSLRIPKGAILGVPAYEMLRDPAKYTNPKGFDAARFVPKDSSEQQVRFTRVSHDFPTWGYGSLAW
jgi:cytochrome P450